MGLQSRRMLCCGCLVREGPCKQHVREHPRTVAAWALQPSSGVVVAIGVVIGKACRSGGCRKAPSFVAAACAALAKLLIIVVSFDR
eukprot:3830841-Alexandrium_andersonii.AAC.1